MGADLYLESVWNPFIDRYAAESRDDNPRLLDPTKLAMRIYDDYRSSGGYFRNGYNCGDVMLAMGYTWDMVSSMLDADHYLPVESARKLVAMIEERPLTKERLSQLSQVFDDWASFLQKRRDELLVILRKSIALNEPLLCSL
jgi:hypothetical protein